MGELWTASGSERVVECPGSQALPRVESEGPGAGHGQVLHGFLAGCASVGRDAALEAAPQEHREALSLVRTDGLPIDPARFRAEVAFAFDLDTGRGRELGQHLGRDYSAATASELPGTVDVIAVEQGRVIVGDYKGGWGDVPPAAKNMQLRHLALAAARTHGLVRATVSIIRVRPDREPFYDEAEYGAYELDETEFLLQQARDRVRVQIAKRAAGEVVDVHSGSWCRYCPARPHCPAFLNVIRAMATAPGDLEQEIRSKITPELAANARRHLKFAKRALALVEDALDDLAREQPIDMGGGVVYGLSEGTEKSYDARAVFEVLRAGYGDEAAKAGVDFEASGASIERGIKAWRDAQVATTPAAKPPQMAREVRKVIATLLKLEPTPGITERPTFTLKEHTPKPAVPRQLEGAPSAPAGELAP